MNRSLQKLAHGRIAATLRLLTAIAAIAAVEAVPLIVVARLVPPALVLPVLSIALLVVAGVLALIAWCVSSRRISSTIWDLSGVCAFVGFSASILSNPEHVVAAFELAAGG